MTQFRKHWSWKKFVLFLSALTVWIWILKKFSVPANSASETNNFNFSVSIRKSGMIDFAKTLVSKGKPVAVAIANNAFIPFSHSWLCNTNFMGIHDQIIIIVPDESSKQQLNRKWPNVHVFHIATILGKIDGAKDYTTVGFQIITYLRAQVVKEMLLMDLDVFVFEFDAVWFRNPIDEFKSQLGSTGDIAGLRVTNRPAEVAIGLLYIRSSNRTKALWTEITKDMSKLLLQFRKSQDNVIVSEALNDQRFMSGLLHSKFPHVNVVLLSLDTFPDGQWYTMEKKNPHPYLINNNWVIGVETKIKRAQKFNHWFWDMSKEKCDFDLVQKVTRT